MSHLLAETLRDAQRFGFFGVGSVDDFIEHARSFVPELGSVAAGSRLIDLGSGGGLPGLVIASERPDLRVVLVDRRQKRTDFLEMAVRRLRLVSVSVWNCDVDAIRRDVKVGALTRFDAATARGFGPPNYFLDCVRDLVSPNGLAVISEPPTKHRWDHADIVGRHLEYERRGQVGVFHVKQPQ